MDAPLAYCFGNGPSRDPADRIGACNAILEDCPIHKSLKNKDLDWLAPGFEREMNESGSNR
jgi:hypothetical protein